MSDVEKRYAAAELLTFAAVLLERSGLAPDRSRVVAEILLEADLMGHSTHGLALLAPYLRELDAGMMTKTGEPGVISDRGAAIAWDGHYLPGVWLVVKALELAFERMMAHPVVTVTVQRSHHIACLAAYLKLATDRRFMLLLAASDPASQTVAPYGGTQPLYSPNPLAVGIPTRSDPILIDMSMSSTANGLVGRLRQAGKRLPHPWLLDSEGNLSDNPDDLFSDPPGSLLPLGGLDLGYKGFALGMMIEAFTGALSGSGRSTREGRWGSSVFLQVIDPAAFGGHDHFTRETEFFADISRNSKVRPGDPPVRMPGSRALQLRTDQVKNGVALYPTILPSLETWSERFGVPWPAPLLDRE